MAELLIGNRYLIPYMRLFPIWRYGPRYGRLTGEYLGEGWSPDWYGTWEVSREQAEALLP